MSYQPIEGPLDTEERFVYVMNGGVARKDRKKIQWEASHRVAGGSGAGYGAGYRLLFFMDKTTAILLRRTRFSDTSLILTWLSPEHGKVRTMAKGALRPKSRFAGGIDLFFEVELLYLRSARSEIHGLREVSLLNPHAELRRSYRSVELAAYFTELMELATEPEHPVPELYDLLRRALGYLNKEPVLSRRALLHFENELARLLGIASAASPQAPASALLAQMLHRLPESRARLLSQLPD